MCEHYQRGALIVSPCCNKEYGCRFCHDENETHEINRYEIKEMVCKTCSTRQPIQKKCMDCKKEMARYYCDICKLLDDSDRSIFHCDKCRVCRVKDPIIVYEHCDICNICINIISPHKCTERALESNCPVCSEWMQTSTQPCMKMKCNHYIHISCYDDYMKNTNTYNCPICSKSLLEEEQLDLLSIQIDQFVETNPTPPEYNHRRVEILCNDCLKKAEVSFQITQYHKCPTCLHYNTSVVG